MHQTNTGRFCQQCGQATPSKTNSCDGWGGKQGSAPRSNSFNGAPLLWAVAVVLLVVVLGTPGLFPLYGQAEDQSIVLASPKSTARGPQVDEDLFALYVLERFHNGFPVDGQTEARAQYNRSLDRQIAFLKQQKIDPV